MRRRRLLPAILLAACAREPAPPPPSPRLFEVRTAPVERGSLPRTLVATGTLHGDEEATIAAKVEGRIAAVHADLGDLVPAGGPLAQVDPTDYALARTERQRALAEALARLGLDAVPDASFDVAQLPSVERARLEARLARSRHERARNLPEVVPEEERERLATAWEVAENDVRLAVLAAREQIAQARTLQAEVEIAEQRLRDTLHAAPGDGGGAESPAPRAYAVAERRVSVGDFVRVGDPLFRVVDADPLVLRVQVPERSAAAVRAGARARVRAEGASGERPGVVARVAPALDPRTRTLLVEIEVANAEGALRPGAFARAEIEAGREEGVLLVPETALRAFAGVHKVVVVDGGKAVERRVTPGQRFEGKVEVEQGLAEGERVVVEPPAALVHGAPVREAGGGAGAAGAEAR